MPRPKKNHAAGEDTQKTRTRSNAEKVFAKKQETPPGPTVVQALATEADLQRQLSAIKMGEADYAKKKADADSIRKTARATLDKIWADAVVILASRGMTKPILRSIFEKSLRDADEVGAAMDAEIWGMRAAGLPVGTQLKMFDDQPQDNATQAYRKGRTAGLDGKSMNDSPYHANSELGQRFIHGWSDGQAILIGGETKHDDNGKPWPDDEATKKKADDAEIPGHMRREAETAASTH